VTSTVGTETLVPKTLVPKTLAYPNSDTDQTLAPLFEPITLGSVRSQPALS